MVAVQQELARLMEKEYETRAMLAGLIASSLMAEGTTGIRPRADQVATMSVEFADAILNEMESKPRRGSPVLERDHDFA